MKGGVTRRIEETVTALDKKQLKKALYLSEAKGLERHHEWIQEAASTCLASGEDKSACEKAIQRAREKVQRTASLPEDDTSLEGLEEYMTEPIDQKPQQPEGSVKVQLQPGKTDEALYEECEPCHIAVAAAKFADVCAENREEAGGGCELISRSLANENTEPADWIKAMVQTAEKAEGKAKQEMTGAITELTEYLERRDSPLLKAIDKEESHA